MSELSKASANSLALPAEQIDEFMGQYKRQLRRRVRSENTMIAYESDWDIFRKWCKSVGLEALPTTEFVAIAYLNYWGMNPDESLRLKASTLKRRIAAIKFFNREEGHNLLNYSDYSEDPIHDTLEMIARDQKAGVRKAKPISQQMLVHMVTHQPDTLTGLRNASMLLTGFTGALRRSELTDLDMADIEFRDLGMVIHIASSKTDQEGKGQSVYVPTSRHPETCAVRTMKKWMAVRGGQPGALYSPIRGGVIGDTYLDRQVVNNIVKESLRLMDVDPTPYSAHSLRSGFATSAAQAGADIRMIMKQTRHARFETAEGYIQDGAGFSNNAVSLLDQL